MFLYVYVCILSEPPLPSRPNVTEVALVDEEWEPSPGDLTETKARDPVGGSPGWVVSGWLRVRCVGYMVFGIQYMVYMVYGI